MGIRRLLDALRSLAPQTIRKVESLKPYAGKRFAIEVSGLMYRFRYDCNENDDVAYLRRFEKQWKTLQANNIRPIYVFDGIPPETKQKVLDQRRQQRETLKESIRKDEESIQFIRTKRSSPDIDPIPVQQKDTDADDTIQTLERSLQQKKRRLIDVRSKHFDALRCALMENKIPYIDAMGEAERTCVLLQRIGLADTVVTDDSDALVHGATIVLRNFDSLSRPTQEIRLEEVLKALQLTHAAFIDYSILCGTEATGTIDGIGWKRGYALMRRYGSIEAILSSPGDGPTLTPRATTCDYRLARRGFLPPTKIVDPNDDECKALRDALEKQVGDNTLSLPFE